MDESVLEKYRSGYSVSEVADMLRLQTAQVQAVVDYYLQHRPTPPDTPEDLSTDDAWHTPLMVDFRRSARACFLAGESYGELKDLLATEDENIKSDLRRVVASTDKII